MREQSPNYFVGLDIGTQNVRCIVGIADQNDPGKLAIVGHGKALNTGMRKGVVVHIDDVAEAVNKAIGEAERLSGIEIRNVTVNVNGTHVSGMDSRGVIAVSSPNRQIGPEERMRVEEAATIVQLPANREILQVFAKNYRLDGQDNIKDPIGLEGVRLEVDTHIVTAVVPNLRSLELALDKAGLRAAHKTVSSLAAAEAVLTRQQKEAGTLLLDIGAGTTNMVVVEDGEVQHIAVIPVGGINITNDLAIGLKTDLDIAEKVKVEHATLAEPKRGIKMAKVEHAKRSHLFDVEDIKMITEARVEELLELVDKELIAIKKSRKLPGGVVLSGGSAQLPGLADFTKEKLQLAARVGKVQEVGGLVDKVDDSGYFTAIGLMMLDMLLTPARGDGNYVEQSGKVFGLVEDLFKRFRSK